MKKCWYILMVLCGFIISCNSSKPLTPAMQAVDEKLVVNIQPLEWKQSIAGNFKSIHTDALRFIYGINNAGSLVKYSVSGDSLYAYNNIKTWGIPTTVDVSNPMRSILFYKPYHTAIILDRFLAPVQVLDLRSKNLFAVSTISNSYDNHVWLLDEAEGKLKKFDTELKEILSSADLRQFNFPIPSPQQIVETNDRLLVVDSLKGLYVFDKYGAILQYWPLKGIQSLEPTATPNEVKFLMSNHLCLFNIHTGTKKFFAFNLKQPYHAIFLGNNMVYTSSTDSLRMYSMMLKP